MAKQSELISPAILADMKAELESLSKTEPGARGITEVVSELMPLIHGCRERGHSWKRIAESLKKYHSDLTVSRLKRLAFELDPSLKSGSKKSSQSPIPKMNQDSDSNNDSDDSQKMVQEIKSKIDAVTSRDDDL